VRTHAIVMAAGKGTRMKSDLAKVLHRAAGRPLVSWMLDLLESIDIDRTVVVVGHQADAVREVLPDRVETALQAAQLGTGHATMVGLAALQPGDGDAVLVLPGDMPLISAETLRHLVEEHEQVNAAATILTVMIDDPPPYGRIVRDDDGRVIAVVEARDASEAQLAITELNTSVYLFDAVELASALQELSPENDQGELYLTDVIGILTAKGLTVAAVAAADAEEGRGVNTVAELEEVGARLAARAARPRGEPQRRNASELTRTPRRQ
jgi:bifunctional UDP-N-acetylglucosamine pyrophosphorylase/glucosamine-1-phosphate N-acetyltransferase